MLADGNFHPINKQEQTMTSVIMQFYYTIKRVLIIYFKHILNPTEFAQFYFVLLCELDMTAQDN